MQRAFLMEKLGQKTFYLSEDVNFWAADLSITNKKDFLIKNQSLKELSLINTYRANRMSRNLPIRGQRTHTNAKTRRKRKTN
jgi:ribosomal protein S13